MSQIHILGSGYAVANNRIHNDDLAKVIDTSDEWIVTRTGIQTRYVSSDENTSDLGFRAAQMAITNAAIDKEEIDIIICATMTPDNATPSSACLIQAKLGLNDTPIMAFDINAACSGYVYAFQLACSMLASYKCALIVGSEVMSKLIDWNDRNSCVLFGDGAGAMILKRDNQSSKLNTAHFARSKGDIEGFLKAEGLSLKPPLQKTQQSVGYLQQNGSEVFRFAIKAMEDSIIAVLEKSGTSMDDIDVIVAHQANLRIIKHVAKRMKQDINKFYTNVERFGNTSAASIAIAFAEAQETGVIKAGMKVILVGFGGGFTYAASYIEL